MRVWENINNYINNEPIEQEKPPLIILVYWQ